MPLPIYVMFGMVALGGLGVALGGVGINDINKAKKIVKEAKEKYEKDLREIEAEKLEILGKANQYAEHLKRIFDETILPFHNFLKKLGKAGSIREINVPAGVELDLHSLGEFELKVFKPAEDFAKLIGAVSSGFATGSTAIGLVTLFGTASTGTAISSLSGAAATNATLAWFGGGSLASGGLGVAGGTVVIGGIVLTPILFTTGVTLARKGYKALTEAKGLQAKVDVECKKLKNMQEYLGKVGTRIDELANVIRKVDTLTKKVNSKLYRFPNSLLPYYLKFISKLHRFPRFYKLLFPNRFAKHLGQSLILTKALTEIMTTPILDNEGKLTTESGEILLKYKKLIEEV